MTRGRSHQSCELQPFCKEGEKKEVKSTYRPVWIFAELSTSAQSTAEAQMVLFTSSYLNAEQCGCESQELCCSEGAMAGCAAELDLWLWARCALTSAFPRPLSWCCFSFYNCSFLICVDHYSTKHSFAGKWICWLSAFLGVCPSCVCTLGSICCLVFEKEFLLKCIEFIFFCTFQGYDPSSLVLLGRALLSCCS